MKIIIELDGEGFHKAYFEECPARWGRGTSPGEALLELINYSNDFCGIKVEDRTVVVPTNVL